MYIVHMTTCKSSVRERTGRWRMMATNVADIESHHNADQTSPLLDFKPQGQSQDPLVQQAMKMVLKSSADLTKLLPTGTVLAFQILSPIFNSNGKCNALSRFMSGSLVAFCGLFCVIQSFTDSFKDDDGVIRYGLATFRGLWIIDGSTALSPEKAAGYNIRFIDFVHAFMALLVFVAVALFDQNVRSCLYPNPSEYMKNVLVLLPVGVGVISSILFASFPTTRHGIGFPIVPH